jgi:hypothetical protein
LKRFDEAVQSGGVRHNPRSRSWLDSVKAFFEKMGA